MLLLLVDKKSLFQSLSICPCYYSPIVELKAKCAPKWEVFELLQLFESAVNNTTSTNSLFTSELEISILTGINKAVVFVEFEYFGEAHFELCRLQDKIIEVISLNFNIKSMLV